VKNNKLITSAEMRTTKQFVLQNALKLTLFYNLINPKINPFFTQINPNNAPNYYKTQKKLGGAPY